MLANVFSYPTVFTISHLHEHIPLQSTPYVTANTYHPTVFSIVQNMPGTPAKKKKVPLSTFSTLRQRKKLQKSKSGE